VQIEKEKAEAVSKKEERKLLKIKEDEEKE